LRSVLDWLAYFAVRTVICVVQASRIETCVWWSNVLAGAAYDWVRLRRDVIDENLRHAFPDAGQSEREEMARRMWRHLFVMVCEVAHAPRKIHETTWREHVVLHDGPTLVNMLLSRRPRVLVSGHFGNFEMGGFIAGLWGARSYAVARPLDNRFLHNYVTRFRGITGQYLLPKDGSAAQIQAVLDSGGILSLLADQHAGSKGAWVQFFGRPASCHKALALFTLTANAPMYVCAARRADRPLRFHIEVAEMFDPVGGDERLLSVPALSQWYSEVLEREIRKAPEQYWWVHRRWREPPSPERRKAKRQKLRPPAAA
jgi:KDO2-lipid IV(A) lauroyltransferase